PGEILTKISGANLTTVDAAIDGVGFGARGDGCGEFVRGAEDHDPAWQQRFGEHSFLPRDGLAAAEVLDVGDADVGDDGDVRCGQRGQRCDLAGMIHADLEDTDLVAAARTEQGQGQTDV